jgi:hypothetical protein
MSPELETLDQLLGSDLPLEVIAKLFPSEEDFGQGVLGPLSKWRCPPNDSQRD